MNVANDCASRTLAALRDELTELVTECAPRRFALCWLDPDEEDGGVLAWGLDLPSGEVVVMGDNDKLHGTFRSAESARKLLGRHRGDLVLLWLDEPAPAQLIDSGP